MISKRQQGKRQSKLTAEVAAEGKAKVKSRAQIWVEAKAKVKVKAQARANTQVQAQGQDFTNWHDLGNWQKQTACVLDALAQEYYCLEQ